ncbi:MAG TPA: DUF4124 domain-containing protein [Oxalicibacterium sp.]|nr:DUF4124 domain-containing protein [Oxalicibacterium sp.]
MIARLSVVFAGISLAVVASVWTVPSHAKDLYRWVDEQGRTQISDTVPPQYRNKAKRIDTRASQVSEGVRARAVERAEREKALAAETAAPAKATNTREPVQANRPGGASPSDKDASCEQQRRNYAASQACFASYRNANGSVRSEAYQYCTEAPDPSPSCGIPSN